jgi:hypothetical protein
MSEDRDRPIVPEYASATKTDLLTRVLVAAQVIVGVAIAVIAGPVFARAVAQQSLMLWITGGVCLVTGVALAAAGLTSSKRRVQALLHPESTSAAPEQPRDPTMPMLGALLVYKYKLITEGQLEHALEHQRREARKGNRLLLGDVLLEMGLVREGQLRRALEYQRSRARQGLGRE